MSSIAITVMQISKNKYQERIPRMKKEEMVNLVIASIHFNLVRERLIKLNITEKEHVKNLNKVQLQILLDIIDFESRW
jgi:2',3'-cyclic-nucleotide 2'-phosphodiesterase (5'-nucleotidase family)